MPFLGSNIWDQWDFAAGEAEFKKAFALDPDDATAHQWHAEGLICLPSRQQEAIAEITLAHQLDPLSPVISSDLGFIRYAARHYDEAIVLSNKVLKENTTFAAAHSSLSLAYWGKHMYPQVIEEWKLFGQLSGDRTESEFASALEQGFRAAGWNGALRKGIQVRLKQPGYSSPFDIATLYADLGDKDQAFGWLNTAYAEHDPQLQKLRVHFLLDPLRSDPRFSELIRNVGVPE